MNNVKAMSPKELESLDNLSKSTLVDLIKFIFNCKTVDNIDALENSIQSVSHQVFQNDDVKVLYCNNHKKTAPNINFNTPFSSANSSAPSKQSKSHTNKKHCCSKSTNKQVTKDTSINVGCFGNLSNRQFCLVSEKENATTSKSATEVMNQLIPYINEAFSRVDSGKSKPTSLTPREKEVLNWVAQGKGCWETGVIVGISERTVKFHLQNIYRKLNVVNRAQAIAKAMAEGIF